MRVAVNRPIRAARARSRARTARAARRPDATGATASVAGYAQALRRFWWVLAIGALFALLAALSARFTISVFPPGLDEKEEVSYTAESRLLVTSADNPHFRSKETVQVPSPQAAETTDEGTAARERRRRSGRGGHGSVLVAARPEHDRQEREHVPVHHRVRPGGRLSRA